MKKCIFFFLVLQFGLTFAQTSDELIQVIHETPELVGRIISTGIDVNQPNRIGETPLVVAISVNAVSIVKTLLEANADVNLEDQYTRTPLDYAASKENGDPQITELIIKKGANTKHQDKSGDSALHFAAFYQNAPQLEILVKVCRDVNIKNNDGETPLISATNTFMCKEEIVEMLIESNVSVNEKNSHQQTALMCAAKNVASPRIILLLLKAGANAKLEDDTGRTALDYFDMNKRINKSEVRKNLKDAMR